MGLSGSGARLVGLLGSDVRISDSFHMLISAVVRAVARSRGRVLGTPVQNAGVAGPGCGYRGDETLWPQDTSAPVPKCPGHFVTGAEKPLSVTYTRRRASQSLNTEQCRPLSLTFHLGVTPSTCLYHYNCKVSAS